MVHRIARKKIIFVAAVIGLIVGTSYFFAQPAHPKGRVYSATNESLDLAIAGGIVEAGKMKVKESSKAVIVPHHLVASRSIALGIQALAATSPRLIVIISPDHFARCPKLLCTTYGKYDTFFGAVTISSKAVRTLERSEELVGDSSLFTQEHGIYTIIPYIKHYIPDAEILPIAVSQRGRGSEKTRAQIIALLEPILARNDTALVISSDFSHYLPLAQSNAMDAKTQHSFCSGNSEEILALQNPSQSDCPLCLWIAEQEAQTLGFWHPTLVAHTNSADLLHDVTAPSTTSHFTFTLSATPSEDNCHAAR